MSAAVDVATGLTLTFGTSSWAPQITGVGQAGVSREAIATSHHGTAAAGAGTFGNATFVPGRIVDPGSLEIEGHYNPDEIPPIGEDAETVTLAYAASGGDSSGATVASSGFLTDFSTTGELDGKITFTATLKRSGNVTRTAGS